VSLATRCSSCSTVFRVQQEQLKASEGWVRCGRCGTVFSALEGLFDLEREGSSGPIPLSPAAPAPAPQAGAAASAPTAPPAHKSPSVDVGFAAGSADNDDADDYDDGRAVDLSAYEDTRATQGHASTVAAGDDGPGNDDESNDVLVSFPATPDEDEDDDAALQLTEHGGSHTQAESMPMITGPVPLTPSFMRDGLSRQARWGRPVVRRLTIAGAFVLPLVLGMQMAVHHRDLVAARWPATAEPLRAVCAALDCELQPLRSLDALAVESSGLTRVEGAALYRLQVAVRNRAAWAVATPAFDLTLTDTRGEIVSRRVLRASELAPQAPQQVDAGSEWSVQATLDVGERRVAGYTIDLFYP
jgi:predicted Zn finger-like uncharacterized protein